MLKLTFITIFTNNFMYTNNHKVNNLNSDLII